MRILPLAAILLLLPLTFAFAHDGALSLYLDQTITDCDAAIGLYETVHMQLYYVRGTGPEMGNGFEFRLVKTEASATYVDIQWPPGSNNIGNLTDGIAVTTSSCLGGGGESVVWLGQIGILALAALPQFYITIVEHPTALPSPGIYIIECVPGEWPKHEVLGGSFIFNPNPGNECNPGVRASSWGAIKGMYK